MMPIRLVPLTAKGRRKLKEGLPAECFILDGPKPVQCFDGAAGVLVGIPEEWRFLKGVKAFSFKNRWIRFVDDPDFSIEGFDENQ